MEWVAELLAAYGSRQGVVALALSFLCGMAMMSWLHRSEGKKGGTPDERDLAAQSGRNFAAKGDTAWDGIGTPLRWTVLHVTGAPKGGPENILRRANTLQPVAYENDFVKCKMLAMHRPTFSSQLERSGRYPYAWHFKGRKRLWECRVQLQWKTVPKSSLWCGIEMKNTYGPPSATTLGLRALLKATAKSVLGNDFYFSPGDDPETTDGEAEPLCFCLPIWALDQFVVSEKDDKVPTLDQDFASLGQVRTKGLGAYVKAMKAMCADWSEDRTYTFLFWGVSQLIDICNWELRLHFGKKFDFETFLGPGSPLTCVFYELQPGVTPDETRHLLSRKKYAFKVALWTLLKPPEKSFTDKMVEPDEPSELCRNPSTKFVGPQGRWSCNFGCG